MTAAGYDPLLTPLPLKKTVLQYNDFTIASLFAKEYLARSDNI
jgi:hypothetical protein